MKRLLLLVAGAALAAAPAVFGLTDNPTLSHSVPVRVPSGAVPVTDTQIDDSVSVRHGENTSGKDGTSARSGGSGSGN